MKKINLPTKITIARIVLATLLLIGVTVLYLVDQYNPFIYTFNFKIMDGVVLNEILLVIFVVFLIGSLTDYLDGHIARKYNMVTELGKFLDPIADKMLVNGMIIFLALNFCSIGGFVKFPFFCVIILVIRDIVVDGLRFICARKNVVIAANIFGKLKTVLEMVTISIVLLNGFPFSFIDSSWPTYLHISDILCYLTTIASVVSGIIYFIQNKDCLKEDYGK